MPDVAVDYGRLSDLDAFFGNFQIIFSVWNIISSSNFQKLCVLDTIIVSHSVTRICMFRRQKCRGSGSLLSFETLHSPYQSRDWQDLLSVCMCVH